MSIDLLIDRIREKKNPTVAGLDPTLSYLPPGMLERHIAEHGETLKAAAEALYEFNRGLIDALAPIVPAVKLQSAFYEAFGPEGVYVLQRSAAYAREQGLYVMIDCKRGDISTVAEAYAAAYFGGVTVGSAYIEPFGADCITINGYMGSDALTPFLKYCESADKAVFVLAKTSNPSAKELQNLLAGDRPVYKVIADHVDRLTGRALVGRYGYAQAGLVVGATQPAQLRELRDQYPRLFFLVPGYGAQGGSARDIVHAFDKLGRGAVVNASRSMMCAWQKTGKDGADYAEAARDEAVAMRDTLKTYVTIA